MDTLLTDAQRQFRATVKLFIQAKLPDSLRRKGMVGEPWTRHDYVCWQQILNEHGWGAPGWPIEYGGTGWSVVERYIFDTECALAGAPRQIPFGLNMVAPVIMEYGTDEQKSYFLPRIKSLEHWWAQGYSEPGSGSDLASIRTSAIRKGSAYIVNGQKIWTTFAHYANWIFCLVRTSNEGKPQAGISFLLIDMTTPGITVSPIRTIDGTHELNEVHFKDVSVPVANRIGLENHGWTYAKYLLRYERLDIARVGHAYAALVRLKDAARRYPSNKGRPLIEDPRFRDRLAWIELQLRALEVLNMRMMTQVADNEAGPSDASILKVAGSKLHQEIAELTMRTLGPDAAYAHDPILDNDRATGPTPWVKPVDRTFTSNYFNMRKTTIYGGSNEIQKNLIARSLGL